MLPLVLRTVALFTLACVLGYAGNALRPDGVSLAPVEVAASCGGEAGAAVPTVLTVLAADAVQLLDAGDVLLLDARAPADYARGHVDRALHLPCASAAQELERAVEHAERVSVILVYGSDALDPRPMAEELALRLGGSARLSIVDGGYDALVAAGAAAESGLCETCGEGTP